MAFTAGMLGTAAPAAAQTDIRQAFPFEGTPGEIPVSPTVTRCGGSADFGPFFGSTAEPFSGDTFVGFHESLGPGSPAESFSVPIDGSTAGGEDYRYAFMARIAPINVNSAAWRNSNQGANSGEFRVYTGATPCAQGQLIGTVSLDWPDANQWLAQQLEFTATGAYGHLTFAATPVLPAGNATYFGIDDAVPQLQKEFSPDQVSLGGTSSLTFTVENVAGLPAQTGWSFTDNLPAGVKVASPNGEIDCTNGEVTAALDGATITVSGDLEAGQESCTASVEVMATDVGTHLNNHENFSDLVGISPPPPAELTCTDPPDPQTEDLPGVFVDCDFSDDPPETDFSIQQAWQADDAPTVAYQTPMVGDLYGTGEPVAVVGGRRNLTGGSPQGNRRAQDLHIVDGGDGSLIDTIETPYYNWSGHAAVAIADVNADGRGEILLKVTGLDPGQPSAINGVPVQGRLIAYTYNPGVDDWEVLWVSDQRYDYGESRGGHGISVADFNGDEIPEAYVGNQIFNARTGVRLAAAGQNEAAGCHTSYPPCYIGQATAADMTGDSDLELVAGNVVYDVEINDPNDFAANSISVDQEADSTVPQAGDGFTAIADLDLDGDPDAIVAGQGYVYAWDGQTDEVMGAIDAPALTGAPLIGDIDGDGRPEIVFVTPSRLHAYDYVPGTGLVQKWIKVTNDGSGQTSLAMFDFNNDASQELVYRDQSNLRIMDGSGDDAVDHATIPCTSGTHSEMPVIADIDGSLQARILVTCGTSEGDKLLAFETAGEPWANARPVWNQQAYFVAHINDDLTVPANQFEHWTVFSDPDHRCSDGANRPLNSFQQQVTDLDSETGCPVICVPASLEVDKTSDPASGAAVQPGDTIDYTVAIENTSSADVTDVDLTDDLTEVLDDATITSGPTVDPPGAGTAQITGNELAFNGTIPQGETVTITYEATVKPRGQLGNRMLENSVIGEFSNCDGITARLRCMTKHPVAVSMTDLQLEKTADAVVSPGDPVGYTLTVTNNGPDGSTGSTVTDNLPASLTNVQVPQNCELQGSTVTCEVGPLGSGQSTDIDIAADAPQTPSACFENQASVEAADDDLEQSNDDASARTCTTPAADLEIQKSVDSNVVSQGGQVTYTLTVTNNGPDQSSGSTVTDTLPAEVTNVQAQTQGCSVQGNTVTCDVGPLNSGDSTDIEITGDAPQIPSTCFENDASVEGDEGDPVLGNNEDSARTCTTPAADLELAKSAPATVNTGGEVTWTLTITNNGPDTSTGSTVTDALPAGISNIEAQGCDVQGQTITCDVGPIDSGNSTDIEITGDAPNTHPACFTNNATVEGDEGDPDLGNNDSSATTCTTESDLELEKAAPAFVDPGDEVTWTITVTNHGPDASSESTVTDTLPAGITNPQAPQNCQVQGLTITCDVDPLNSGDSTDIVVTGDSPDTPSTCFENDAAVESGSDPNSANDSASVRTCTTPVADLELEKSAPVEVDPGGQVTWELTVTNNGPNDSLGATVTDTVPNGITDIQAPQDCEVQGQSISCVVGPLNSGDSTQIEISGTAPPSASTCFENNASVEGEEGDPDLANNDASVETCTNEGADLEITKVADAGPHVTGGQATYTLTVTNTGPATAHDVQVSDDLPDTLGFVSATPDQGTCNDQDPLACDLGTIANGDSVEIELVAEIDSDQAGNEIDNTACVEAIEPDPDALDACSDATIEVAPEADLEITKTVDPGGPVRVGELLTYTLVVTNHGPNDASDAVVTDTFAKAVKVVSAEPSQGTCSGTRPIECELGTVANGDSATVVITARPLKKGKFTNAATVDASTSDPDETNNRSSVPKRVRPGRVDVSKRANRAKAGAGDIVTYRIVVRSRSRVPLRNLKACDKLPKQLKLVAAPGAKIKGNKACWRFNLPAQGKRKFKVKAKVKPSKYPVTAVNTASVNGPDVSPARDRERVKVNPKVDKGEGPGPCRAATRRC